MINEKYCFQKDEIEKVRKCLLDWYYKNKRRLPWRQLSYSNQNSHAYCVWVSEIMLQQTRVSTVIDYYNRWIAKWPSISSLAQASPDEVNQMWAGLGYYSRGRRLLEGAQKVMDKYDGVIPTDAASLMKNIPGVGRYTASAVASIAFNEVVGVVDGNVMRVLSRLRAIGGSITNKQINLHLWSLSNELVDEKHPGDFNQAMMELGAMICTPKSPNCASCPLKFCCQALAQVESHNNQSKTKLLLSNADQERQKKLPVDDAYGDNFEGVTDIENCADSLALTHWDPKLGVENYPQKVDKKAPKLDYRVVFVFQLLLCRTQVKEAGGLLDKTSKFLVSKRPKAGLLANLWEFPNRQCDSQQLDEAPAKKRKYSATFEKILNQLASEILNDVKLESFSIERLDYAGKYVHKFSHIHQSNAVYSVQVVANDPTVAAELNYRWVDLKEYEKLAKPTLTVNIFKTFCNFSSKGKKDKVAKSPKQASIESFFKKEVKV